MDRLIQNISQVTATAYHDLSTNDVSGEWGDPNGVPYVPCSQTGSLLDSQFVRLPQE